MAYTEYTKIRQVTNPTTGTKVGYVYDAVRQQSAKPHKVVNPVTGKPIAYY